MRVLTWNLAFGNMLSYNWQWADNDPLGNLWLDLVAALQRTVAARSAGRTLASYTELTADVTQSRFGDLAVIANWHPSLTYPTDGHHVAPGEHYIVVERTPHVVTVRQPVGTDAALRLAAPDDWQPGETLHVWVHDRQGNVVDETGFWMDGRQVYFVYRQEWNGPAVGHYALVNSLKIYLPLIVRGA